MQILEVLDTLKAQVALERTSCGRPVTEYAISIINAAISDEKNFGSEALICQNCCIILSSLLVPEGCVNCGGKDLSDNINNEDVL